MDVACAASFTRGARGHARAHRTTRTARGRGSAACGPIPRTGTRRQRPDASLSEMQMSRHRLRKRYGHANSHSREALLQDALRDWRSGRAFVANGKGHRYMLHPVYVSDSGVASIVRGRATVAPWSKAANAEWGPDSDGLHRAAQAKYPRPANLSDFERMHAMDPVRTKLLEESAKAS